MKVGDWRGSNVWVNHPTSCGDVAWRSRSGLWHGLVAGRCWRKKGRPPSISTPPPTPPPPLTPPVAAASVGTPTTSSLIPWEGRRRERRGGGVSASAILTVPTPEKVGGGERERRGRRHASACPATVASGTPRFRLHPSEHLLCRRLTPPTPPQPTTAASYLHRDHHWGSGVRFWYWTEPKERGREGWTFGWVWNG